MFRTTIKALSLFRTNSNYSNYSYSHVAFKKKEQPRFHNDAFNMFMLSAFVKESANNINSQLSKSIGNHDTELKIICEITGCEKNNKDCSCEKICIVTKSEISMICDLLQ